MTINPITFGVPEYSPSFTVSTGDVDNIKLRSKETAPLSHESLDENFCNIANKVNEILNTGVSDIVISSGVIATANLQLSGTGVILVSSSGVISHADRSAASGYNVSALDGTTNAVVNGLITDSNGHVTGYKTRDIDLSSYATSADLSSYATSDSLSIYLTSSDLSSYATSADLANYLTSADLSGYATSDSLSNYLTSADLSGYATSADLSNYLTSADLSNYATSADLADYVEKTDFSFDASTGTLTITTS
jgi:hypothetical protein